MQASEHENILTYHVSFITSAEVWLVMPVMTASSVSEVLKLHPGGVKDERTIATIMRESL